jgi:hypothetical protein
MANKQIVPYGVEDAIPLSVIPPREITPIPSQSYFAQAIHHPVIAPPPMCLLLQDKPCQVEAPTPIKVTKEINLLPPRMKGMLMGGEDQQFWGAHLHQVQVSHTSRVTIDGVQAAPKQVKVVPPKEKKKRTPPTAQDNDETHQWMTIVMLNEKTHAL